ncbi:MAG: hypothetical protein CVU39_22360 [Chloroflexi bacterium HGW-Chloroflexi-10]|nr:MAG: hypothetical protein CVU39_22360 [Chloroflexi bacterium HGW-Chloroflexi-10]
MNCKNCGAPMSVEEGGNFFRCEYCGGHDFPNPNQDEVALLDEISPYACPKCNEPLVAAIVKNIRIFSCANCRGNLIDQSKILPLLRRANLFESISQDLNDSQNNSELTRTAVCPSCQKLMDVYPYGGSGNIIIQGCSQCLLVWLDFGELSRIIHSYLT